ncbi:MAG: Cthe_2314 family HEPN domain-containing protein [Pedobacter sp.]|nr:Cthe_2314 family HEPN domain-containing protein [Pedobacter sp.]MDQ8051883.1 Cthe_2314 family HEPN domain-containing protein [Pedobacter sp.]
MIQINSGKDKVTFTYAKNDFLMNFFSQRLQEDMSNALKNFQHREGYIDAENNHHLLNEDEKYTSRISRIQYSISKTSEQLGHIRMYINRYPFRKHYLANGVSQLEYIQYHIEALYHKIHTIHEIMLLMINEVYGLGLSEVKCRWPNLVKKLSQTEPPMEHAHRYFKTFENLIGLRHLNSHRGYYEDEEKDQIDLYYGVFFYKEQATGRKIDEETMKMFRPALTRYKLIEYKKKKVQLVDLIISENNKLLEAFLKSLLFTYESRLTEMLGHEKKSSLRELFKHAK